MQNNFGKIKDSIDNSLLSTQDKNELLQVFAKANEGDWAELVVVLSEDPSWVSRLSDNLKAKRIVLGLKDGALWQKILQEEVLQSEGLKD